MRMLPLATLFALCAALPLHAQEPNAGSRRLIPDWGIPIDPGNDCSIGVQGGSLALRVPAGPPPHDLAAEIGVVNAPRVLQPVQGDFRVTVAVEGKFLPGGDSTLAGRTGYTGAGLVLLMDENNCVALQRATLDRGESPHGYANFEQRAAGALEQIGSPGGHPLDPALPVVWLRLERRGALVNGAVSTDGKEWSELAPKKLSGAFGSECQVGVVAVSTSTKEFTPSFHDLKIEKLSGGESSGAGKAAPPSELARLQAEYARRRAEALRPVSAWYRGELEALEKSPAHDQSPAAQSEIAKALASAKQKFWSDDQPELTQALVGSAWLWHNGNDGSSVPMRFQSNGTARHAGMRGKWEITGPSEVTVETNASERYILRFDSSLSAYEADHGNVSGQREPDATK